MPADVMPVPPSTQHDDCTCDMYAPWFSDLMMGVDLLIGVFAASTDGRCMKPCLTGETEVDGATCKTKTGKTYKKTGADAKPIKLSSVKPLESRFVSKIVRPTVSCPPRMAYCGNGKCAANVLGADGCKLYASLVPKTSC